MAKSAWVKTPLGCSWADALLTVGAVLAMSGPLLLTNSGFELDFTNHMWLASVAGRNLIEAGHPTYFLNTLYPDTGVFYPFFAFTAGTLYTAIGAIGELIGNEVVAYIACIMFTVAATYGGMLWLGRELGLKGRLAHAPAATVITSAYYITDLYGRGDIPELIAVSAIAPLAASAIHLVRTPRWRVLPASAFVISAVIFTGSHNITLLWGTTILAGALIVFWFALGVPWRLPYRRLAAVFGLGVASAMINAWFLAPDIVYAHTTIISLPPNGPGKSIWPITGFFDTPAVVLDPLRTVPSQSGTPALYVQAPDWFLAWGLIAGALLLWRRSSARNLRRAWIAAVALVAAMLGILLIESFWNLVEAPFNQIQFPYRVSSYLTYAVAGLVLVGALALQQTADARRSSALVNRLRLALVGACAVSFGLCLWQQWVPKVTVADSYANRGAALTGIHNLPKSWYTGPVYLDRLEPGIAVPPGRLLVVRPDEVHGDRFSAVMNVPPGPQPINTDIGSSLNFVRMTGLRWLGVSSHGYGVVARVNGGSGPVRVTIETAHNDVIELGRILSILGILAVLAVLTWTGVSSRRGDVRRAPVKEQKAPAKAQKAAAHRARRPASVRSRRA
jgi:hypothetical protein